MSIFWTIFWHVLVASSLIFIIIGGAAGIVYILISVARFRRIVRGFVKLQPNINKVVKCPLCEKHGLLLYTIVHLNDIHKMNREWIADWTEELPFDLTLNRPIKSGN